MLREMGVQFRCGVEVGKDVTIAQLREQGYQGFYVAVGLQSGGRLNIPGDDAQGVTAGIDFMRRVNGGQETKLEGRVVVIGGRQHRRRRGPDGGALRRGVRGPVLPGEL